MFGGDGEADTELDGLTDELGESEVLAEGLTELLGESERDADALGEVEREGLTELDGDCDCEAEGDTLEDGLSEGEVELDALELGDMLWLAEGLTDEEGLTLELGETETIKLCIHISQFSEVEPVTFLYSHISPRTLPVGWGPYLTKEGRGLTTPSWSK
jgi:hypothetical protein